MVPDWIARAGIRRLLEQRIRQLGEGGPEQRFRIYRELIAELRGSAVAIETDKANEQHYELPPAFFREVLGPRLKYSCCYWPQGTATLDAAEEAMLELTCRRAGVGDGMRVLDLGCGWGSMALWIAERWPGTHVTAVSNSARQRRHIEAECRARGLDNVSAITADVNEFSTDRRFDRVISVEMFEHVRNYQQLLARIASWLAPGGSLFVHVFCHREHAYPFETAGEHDWMGRYFFSGGLMPSETLLLNFQEDMRLEEQWRVSGLHYRRTLEQWLARLDRRREHVLPILSRAYGEGQAALWLHRWRLFFMACSELFGYRDGAEWMVAHYRFRRARD